MIAVDPRDTSGTCSRCGHCAKDNRLTQAEFRYPACGHTAHADVNAAKNILRAGLALRDAAQAVLVGGWSRVRCRARWGCSRR
ncbi:zinc ribbon domain-containing protein [Nonomuraea zeae]|uniref:zinc ribbon domain-containing protein n=1 Tax=Nonomuraea zeae TaxID=1642303 RepID=UPI0023F174AD|nr:zinc ribbon domain-containing protein [Nonomuraea zeae]